MGHKYTDEELRRASNRVMKSLNGINSKSQKTFTKPAIQNSLGQSSRISKSSKRRQNRKQKSNLGGEKMETLLTSLPEPAGPVLEPRTIAEMKTHKLEAANQQRHHSRKAEQKVFQHEVATFEAKSLDEIRSKIMQRMANERTGEGDA